MPFISISHTSWLHMLVCEWGSTPILDYWVRLALQQRFVPHVRVSRHSHQMDPVAYIYSRKSLNFRDLNPRRCRPNLSPATFTTRLFVSLQINLVQFIIWFPTHKQVFSSSSSSSSSSSLSASSSKRYKHHLGPILLNSQVIRTILSVLWLYLNSSFPFRPLNYASTSTAPLTSRSLSRESSFPSTERYSSSNRNTSGEFSVAHFVLLYKSFFIKVPPPASYPHQLLSESDHIFMVLFELETQKGTYAWSDMENKKWWMSTGGPTKRGFLYTNK